MKPLEVVRGRNEPHHHPIRGYPKKTGHLAIEISGIVGSESEGRAKEP